MQAPTLRILAARELAPRRRGACEHPPRLGRGQGREIYVEQLASAASASATARQIALGARLSELAPARADRPRATFDPAMISSRLHLPLTGGLGVSAPCSPTRPRQRDASTNGSRPSR